MMNDMSLKAQIRNIAKEKNISAQAYCPICYVIMQDKETKRTWLP